MALRYLLLLMLVTYCAAAAEDCDCNCDKASTSDIAGQEQNLTW